MLLTKECDYGIRIIRALSHEERMTVEAISTAEHIPQQYTYKILKKLEIAGYVQGLRGRDGGYRLCTALDSFSLYDVVVAIDKNLFIHECLRDDNSCPHKGTDADILCKVHHELGRIQNLIVEEMQKKNMQKILKGVM